MYFTELPTSIVDFMSLKLTLGYYVVYDGPGIKEFFSGTFVRI